MTQGPLARPACLLGTLGFLLAAAGNASAAVDLIPRAASVGPIPITPGEVLTVTAVIRNAGNRRARNVMVRACDGGGWCAGRNLRGLAPNREAVVKIPLTSAPVHLAQNPHFFTVTVDPQNRIRESDETNNTLRPDKPAFVVDLELVAPTREEEHDVLLTIADGVALGFQRIAYGPQGAPSDVTVVPEPLKGRPHPVTGHVEPSGPHGPGQPRIDPLVAAADAALEQGQRIRYVVKFRHQVPMPHLPALTDRSERFATANLPILERRLARFEAVRRARIAAASELTARITGGGAKVLEHFTLAGAMLVDAPKGMLPLLDASPAVLYVESATGGDAPPDSVADGRALIASDPYFDGGARGAGFMALLDSGVRTSHTLFDGGVRIAFWEDCVNGDGDCEDNGDPDYDPDDDCQNHGTSTAAILTGNDDLGDDSRGITESQLDSWKVYDCGGLVHTAVHRGYDEAVAWGDQIVVAEIQCSHQGSNGSIADDANDAFDAGTITIAANGNYDVVGSVAAPASANKALGIGNYDVDTLAAIAEQSQGPTQDNRYKPDIQAPTNTLTASTASATAIREFGGTSGATPYAAGAASVFADWFGLTTLTAANGGMIYAALINGGPREWGDFDNLRGTGPFALPVNGTLIVGSRNVANHENDYVDFDVPEGAEQISVAIWWGENPSNTHRDIDLYLRRPDGTTSESSYSVVSVFEHAIVNAPITAGQRDIRIYGYDVPAGVSVTVYYAIHVR